MIYDKRSPGDGQWHCPFSPEWVQRMKRAAKHCAGLSAEYIERTLNHEWMMFRLPPGDFLSEQQDARGLPLSWCQGERKRFKGWPECCVSIYDYDTVPDVVVTNGNNDWPLQAIGRVLTA